MLVFGMVKHCRNLIEQNITARPLVTQKTDRRSVILQPQMDDYPVPVKSAITLSHGPIIKLKFPIPINIRNEQ